MLGTKYILEYTLDNILRFLDEYDQGGLQLLPAELDDLALHLNQKVDHLRYKRDELRTLADLQLQYSEEHRDASKALNNEADRLEARMVWSMQTRGFDKLKGTKYSVTLRKSIATEIEDGQKPTPEIQKMCPEYIRETTTLAWNKEALKADIVAGRCPLPFVTLKTNTRPEFKINKGVEDAEK